MSKTNAHMDQVLRRHSPNVRLRAELEYRVIHALLRECARDGFKLDYLDDGDRQTPVRAPRKVLELVFDLDQCSLYFLRSGKRYWVSLVMGNSGWDVISDHTWDGGPDCMNALPGTFAACVNRATKPFSDRYG